MDRSKIIATYRLQDIDDARAQRDRLRGEGEDAFMTRAGSTVFVHMNPPKKAWLDAVMSRIGSPIWKCVHCGRVNLVETSRCICGVGRRP